MALAQLKPLQMQPPRSGFKKKSPINVNFVSGNKAASGSNFASGQQFGA